MPHAMFGMKIAKAGFIRLTHSVYKENFEVPETGKASKSKFRLAFEEEAPGSFWRWIGLVSLNLDLVR